MKSLIALVIIFGVTLLGLAGVPACAGKMEGGKEMKMTKDDAMKKGDSMAESKKAMMKEGSDAMMEQKSPIGMRTARLVGSAGHNATGSAEITTSPGRAEILRFTDLTVDNVPDGRVYLAKNGDYRSGLEVGRLTQFSGTVTFTIPTGMKSEDYDSVVIWCKKFNVEIGRGFFEKKMM